MREENLILKKTIESLTDIKSCVSNIVDEKSDITEDETNCEILEDFKCMECEFIGRNKNGLKIHESMKHKKIIQLDGVIEDESESHDYNSTDKYWRDGYMGCGYQTFKDVLYEIDKSDLSKEEKVEETANAKTARLSSWTQRGGDPSSCNF